MPFMIGSAPIRRTLDYLNAGKIIFRETVKIFSANFNSVGEHHKGARDFIFWHLCQIQYKNPQVQCQTFRNLTPTPFLKIYFEDGKSVLIDIDSREKEEIYDHLVNFTAICKTEAELTSAEEFSSFTKSPSYFGFGCERHCICEIIGQVPCPCIVKLPNIWRLRQHKPSYLAKFRIPPCYMVPGLEPEDEEDE